MYILNRHLILLILIHELSSVISLSHVGYRIRILWNRVCGMCRAVCIIMEYSIFGMDILFILCDVCDMIFKM